MEAKIRIEGLVKEYESFSLKQISLEIPKGSVTGLVGANGAGKTTLLKCIMGIVRKDQGEILSVECRKKPQSRGAWLRAADCIWNGICNGRIYSD